ncbi:AAA family ATPase [Cypionkella sp.]|uniref:AAA family ATPase n=1 Tax=Cypionkella sp. TaxID=2811411 RepID=UPI002AB9AF05|nr:AAA family ATPase [Cypionkella sp.]MDZ4392973.1 AAA family ATPase [Cypionkella sp.]
MNWSEIEAQMPQDSATPFRAQIIAHLRDCSGFIPEAILKKVVVLGDAAGRRMLWGIGSTGMQNFYLTAEVAALLPPEVCSTLPIKLHSARKTYLDSYEGPALELRKPEDLVLLDALSGDPFPRALARWIQRVKARFPNWQGFVPADPAFEADEREYKDAAADKLRQALAAAQDDRARLEALHGAMAGINLLQWQVYWPLSPKGDCDHAAMSLAVSALIAAVPDAQGHPAAVASFIAAWMQHCPNPTRDSARQVAEFALMLLNPAEALLLRRSFLDAMYFEATGLRFPRGEAAQEYTAELGFAHRIRDALRDKGLAPRDLMDVQSLLWVAFNAKDVAVTPPTEPISDVRNAAMTTPTNLILYGPPGTGKTFATAYEAVRICLGDAVAVPLRVDRVGLMTLYRKLVSEGRIEFVTFHQSFSYEDFVEGLRPTTDKAKDDNLESDTPATGGFSLRPHAGVFKQISERARLDTGTVAEIRLDRNRNIFKLSLIGSDWRARLAKSLEDSRMLWGFGGKVDWSIAEYEQFEAVKARWCSDHPDANGRYADISGTWSFRSGVEIGDYVVLTVGKNQIVAVGRVSGAYEFLAEEDEFPHARRVEWIWSDADGADRSAFYPEKFSSFQPIYKLDDASIDWDGLESIVYNRDALPPTAGARDFVLIIDEINRANISKVFGELITLLEADKRLGCLNEVRLRLPYSEPRFGVPSNLHIIGTMNTADRSIALLDTALRRRFTFQELMPDVSALRAALAERGLDANNLDGINLCRLLTTINERIEYLFDRDHQIGHGFFTGCTDKAGVEDVMRHKVIPLLSEYFYDDWSKVAAVLGDRAGSGQTYFLEAKRLAPPDSLAADDMGEEKWRWSVRSDFDFAKFQAP